MVFDVNLAWLILVLFYELDVITIASSALARSRTVLWILRVDK